ncbi:ABC transporter, ATP-binding protein [Minicystis rosea]|nr:ABC transporter, ATP-binding protein [Minicystis rosea]
MSTEAMPPSEEKPKSKTKLDRSGPPAIDLKGVVKKFGAVTAVNDVTFEVPTGSVFGLIGPNGAGKTTTFSMLAGYLAPTSGEIYILDRSPEAVSQLKGKVGVLPQDALLPANEQVGSFLVYLARLQGMDASAAQRATEQVLADVGGADWWRTRCGALSHGMAKRVGLAAALLGDPQVVLLDEPTAGLDPRVAYEVRQLVKSRRGRCTLVISSHNLQELEEVCDHAAILDRGQLITAGTMSELTADSSEVRFELGRGPIPEDEVRAIEGVKTVEWNKAARELVVTFDRAACDAEEMIRRGTYILYQNNARISGISKGRGLEQRVMELTE